MAELDAIDWGEDGHGPDCGEALAAKIARVRKRRQAQIAFFDVGAVSFFNWSLAQTAHHEAPRTL